MADNFVIASVLNGLAGGFVKGMELRQAKDKNAADVQFKNKQLELQQQEITNKKYDLAERRKQDQTEIIMKGHDLLLKAEQAKSEAERKDYLSQLEEYKIKLRGYEELDKSAKDEQRYKLDLRKQEETEKQNKEQNKIEWAKLNKVKNKEGKPLPTVEREKLIEGTSMPAALEDIKSIIESNKDKFGPVGGRIGGVNPWDARSQVIQSKIKDFTLKYTKAVNGSRPTDIDQRNSELVAPKLSDNPDVALNKVMSMYRTWSQNRNSSMKILKDQGFDMSGFGEPPIVKPMPTVLSTKPKSKDDMALEWANSHPTDPRAIKIKQKLGK